MSSSPKVWSKFSVKKKDGTVLNLRIVDATESIFEDVLILYVKYFLNDETTFKAAGKLNQRYPFIVMIKNVIFQTYMYYEQDY